MDILKHNHFYFVGIKGVGMASLAQLLNDAGKTIAGSDKDQTFVTEPILQQIKAQVDHSFQAPLPEKTDCLIYTAAHQGKNNPQVQAAIAADIPVLSQAQALAELFNQKQGIAVCGVGGKSTTSAMLAWIFKKTNRDISYSVGVAEILGLDKVGQWSPESQYFIAEADEYADNPTAVQNGAELIPRFSYLNPQITISKQIAWDHPDVYRDSDHTLKVFNQFFSQINQGGSLIIPISERSKDITTSAEFVWDYGNNKSATFKTEYQADASGNGKTVGHIIEPVSHTKHQIKLQVPGKYNFDNALAAIIGAYAAKIPMAEAVEALKSFRSTKRRFEKVRVKNNITYFDDYAHHPNEITSAITALQEWFPKNRKVIVFQPHTYSRTKALFEQFVTALSLADELVITDIFASAREEQDPTISSSKLVEAIKTASPDVTVHQTSDLPNTADLLKTLLAPGDICLTMGAGDIYKVHKMV